MMTFFGFAGASQLRNGAIGSESISPSVDLKPNPQWDSDSIISASSYVGNSMFGSGVTQCLNGASTTSYVGNDGVVCRLC